MKNIILGLTMFAAISTTSFATPCTVDELGYFDKFLEKSHSKIVEDIANATKDADMCMQELNEGLLKDVERMQSEDEFKAQHCEYAADFCRLNDPDKKKELLRAILHPDCLMSVELNIEAQDCVDLGFSIK